MVPSGDHQLKSTCRGKFVSSNVFVIGSILDMDNPVKAEMEIKVNQAVDKTTGPAQDRIQIKADKKEIQRRIAAFMTRKRKETDELNLQEFCNLPRAEMASEFSCARVDAVVIQRAGSRSHVKVSKVVNEWGPQTMPTRLHYSSSHVAEEANQEETRLQLPQGIEERLSNMEAHLNIKTGNPVPENIYKRLKDLEDRILFLESLSPDYFADFRPPKSFRSSEKDKRQLHQPAYKKDLSLDEIDARIMALKGSLLKRFTGPRI